MYYAYPMLIWYIREIISALVCSSIWTDPHCRYSMAISLLPNAPFISTTYLKVRRHFNAQCNDLIIMMNVAIIMIIMTIIMMMTMMILCCLSLCIGLSPRQVRDEPEFCCYYHLRKDNPVTRVWHPGPGNFAPFWMVPVPAPEKNGPGKKYWSRYRKKFWVPSLSASYYQLNNWILYWDCGSWIAYTANLLLQ